MTSDSAHSISDVLEHYERLLAPVYVWMIGGIDAAVERNQALFARLGFGQGETKSPMARALDVGAGPGPQSLALATCGYQVTALDPCQPLLDVLSEERARRQLPIEIVRDAAPLEDRHPGPFEVVTCMVDTLVSLPSVAVARTLVADLSSRLTPGGALVLSWRDLTALPSGDARFLPVRSDAERVLSCFLEAVDDTHVRVHDILHQRSGATFAQTVSSYTKLRLSPALVDGWLSECGLHIERREVERGMAVRLATRPR